MVAVIVIDSNIWIFASVVEYAEHPVAEQLLERLLVEDVVAINAIIVSEVYHKLAAVAGVEKARERLAGMFSSDRVRYLSLPKETAEAAVRLAHAKGLRINDALIAQHAIDEGAALLTHDRRHFAKVPRLRTIPLQ